MLPRAIESWRPRIDAITTALLDKVALKGSMDLVADLARPVPATLAKIASESGILSDRLYASVLASRSIMGLAPARR